MFGLAISRLNSIKTWNVVSLTHITARVLWEVGTISLKYCYCQAEIYVARIKLSHFFYPTLYLPFSPHTICQDCMIIEFPLTMNNFPPFYFPNIYQTIIMKLCTVKQVGMESVKMCMLVLTTFSMLQMFIIVRLWFRMR